MKIGWYLIILLLNTSVCFSQRKKNIVCRDFTFEQELSTRGKNLRNIFEIAISKSNYPFKVLERDKMDKFFETLQEEKNLVKDLSTEWKKKLQLANIDYLVVGDINEIIGTDKYDLIINFIKITGDNITEKIPLLITIGRRQLSNNEELKILFDKEIQSFINSYFITDQSDSSLVTIPKFYKELRSRDSIINNLTNSVSDMQQKNQSKDAEIKKLSKEIRGIKEYANYAKMDLWGLEMHGSGSLNISSGLSRLMDKVIITSGNEIKINTADSALSTIDAVIQKFPSFPFGYWAKTYFLISRNDQNSMIYALKAIEILEVTTTISGHNDYHDKVLAQLNELLKINGVIKQEK